MQEKGRTAANQRLANHVNGAAGAVDDGRAEDPDLMQDIGVGVRSGDVERRWIDGGPQVHVPDRPMPVPVRIEGVDAVMHGGHVKHVERTFTRHA